MIVGVVLAAGRGERFGARKQDQLIAGISVLDRAVRTAQMACDAVLVVYDTGDGTGVLRPGWTVIQGGDTRSQSVRAALAVIERAGMNGPDDIIVVHDAARCLASLAVWSRVVAAVQAGAVCAVPTIGITDSIRRRGGQPANRDEFWAVQTPQAFQAAALCELHADQPECSDDAGLLTLGVQYVPGETSNIKITHPDDLQVAAALLRGME